MVSGGENSDAAGLTRMKSWFGGAASVADSRFKTAGGEGVCVAGFRSAVAGAEEVAHGVVGCRGASGGARAPARRSDHADESSTR